MAYDRKSFYAMNKKETDADKITYPFIDGEIVTIKRIRTEDGNVSFIEIRKTEDGVVTTSTLTDDDMNDELFTQIRKSLVACSRKEDIADSKYTRKFLSLENLCDDASSCVSAEDEYLEELENQERLRIEETDITARTSDNATKILDICLTEIQKQRFIRNKCYKESTRDIAENEGKCQNAIHESIASSEKKIKNFWIRLKKTGQNAPKMTISEGQRNRSILTGDGVLQVH